MENIQQNQNISQPLPDDEIDLIALAKTAWSGRRTIIKTTLIFIVLGVFIAIFTPKQYKAIMVMIPQSSNPQSSGGLSSLAAMAGINLNMSNSGNELSPSVYPQIVQSIPFQKELMHVKLNFEGYNEKISLYDYYTDPQYAKFNVLSFIKKFTIGLPGTIIGAIRGKKEIIEDTVESDNTIIQLSSKERALIDLLSANVTLNADQKAGNITLTSIMPEAKAAAQLGEKAQILLQAKITEFKIAKSNMQLDFIQERYNEKKKEFEEKQKELALFNDRNKNVTTAIARTEGERLQNEYQLVFSVYTELSKQLENSKIQVKNETPVFSIIEPISIPTESFKPKRKQILMIWIFLGGVIGTGIVFGKQYIGSVKEKWNESKE